MLEFGVGVIRYFDSIAVELKILLFVLLHYDGYELAGISIFEFDISREAEW